MKQKTKREKQMPPGLRYQAIHVAMRLLGQGHPDDFVLAAVQGEFSITEAQARYCLQETWKMLRDAPDPDPAERKRLIMFRADELYAAAMADKQYGAARGALVLQAQLMRLIGQDQPPVAPKSASEFDGRTDDELLYFNKHGYWPSDAAKRASSTPADPLGRLN